jgi:hypothetical protein
MKGEHFVALACNDFRFHMEIWRRIKYAYMPCNFVSRTTLGMRAIGSASLILVAEHPHCRWSRLLAGNVGSCDEQSV